MSSGGGGGVCSSIRRWTVGGVGRAGGAASSGDGAGGSSSTQRRTVGAAGWAVGSPLPSVACGTGISWLADGVGSSGDGAGVCSSIRRWMAGGLGRAVGPPLPSVACGTSASRLADGLASSGGGAGGCSSTRRWTAGGAGCGAGFVSPALASSRVSGCFAAAVSVGVLPPGVISSTRDWGRTPGLRCTALGCCHGGGCDGPGAGASNVGTNPVSGQAGDSSGCSAIDENSIPSSDRGVDWTLGAAPPTGARTNSGLPAPSSAPSSGERATYLSVIRSKVGWRWTISPAKRSKVSGATDPTSGRHTRLPSTLRSTESSMALVCRSDNAICRRPAPVSIRR